MLNWLRELDRTLRGETTRMAALRGGRIDIPAAGLSFVTVLLGMFYGVCMGSFAVVSGKAGTWMQVLSSMVKVPALFFLTLLVTFPSLYVFNALVGSRLSFTSLLRLMVASMAVMLALLASFGTIVAFFSFTTESYSFMVLLNVVVYAVAGFLGLSFLLQTLNRLTMAMEEPLAPPPPPLSASQPPPIPESEPPAAADDVGFATPPTLDRPGALDRLHPPAQKVKNVFRVWIIVFGLVGAQMSWVLRPFIGSTNQFALYRPRGGNFFEAVVYHLVKLFGGGGHGHW
jgi:hypothetical protein